MTIGFIGNFIPPFSTENDRKWSFEKLGHRVLTFQENETDPAQLLNRIHDIDLLLYSHTHDPAYHIIGLKAVFIEFEKHFIPTASVHLDRWAWLKREEDIGKEATWFAHYQFMADFSPEAVDLYIKHRINAYHLLPGVVERDCYMDKNYNGKDFLYDVVFVGSRGYHPEYPFRPKLIDFLKETYGNRFGHYGNDGEGVARGEALNRLYAVSKVVVGDTCFGGRPNYVSDRYYETRGRGGFLLHPYVEGIDTIGIGEYEAGNLVDLKTQIDYWLKHNRERETRRKLAHHYVKSFETYTQRAEELLDVIFLKP